MAAANRTMLADDPWRHGQLQDVYVDVRSQSERLAEPLNDEDYVVQSMPDVSPTKWHLAHTSWFFETFLLAPFIDDYRPVDDAYAFLFNSYYEGAGPRHARPQRGLLSRPTVRQVYEYRHEVDRRMRALLDDIPSPQATEIMTRLRIGLHHEQQHQELLLMDIKHVFSMNPMFPTYLDRNDDSAAPRDLPALSWLDFDGGVVEVGNDGRSFTFDNETPRHKTYLQPFRLATRPVTNREYIRFIEDGGYERAELWLADGWHTVRANEWAAPLYWHREDSRWMQFTLHGLRPADTPEPVVHVSFYEADAYARWAGHRLPTEFEWEFAAADAPLTGHFLNDDRLHPQPVSASRTQLFGDVWEHTQSGYSPYPGFQPLEGTLGEYNGKFMCSQNVLRGGSCLTPQGHLRATYRNYFYPHQRWCAQGIRLAASAR